MADEMRRMLQELMGQDPATNGKKIHFTDSDVCRNFLCGLCPHDLFPNTRLDFGKCPKIHSEHLQREYQEARKSKDYGYEYDWERTLSRIAHDNDLMISRQKQRVEDTQSKEVDLLSAETMAKIADAEKKMVELDAQIDELTAELKVDEMKEKNDEKEALEKQIKEWNDSIRNNEKTSTGGLQKLRVCEVCGAQLSSYEVDERLADHFTGKMHVGMKEIRDTLEKLRTTKRETSRSGSRERSRSPRRDDRRRYDDRRYDDRRYDDRRYDDRRYDDRRYDSRRYDDGRYDDRRYDDRRDRRRDDRY